MNTPTQKKTEKPGLADTKNPAFVKNPRQKTQTNKNKTHTHIHTQQNTHTHTPTPQAEPAPSPCRQPEYPQIPGPPRTAHLAPPTVQFAPPILFRPLPRKPLRRAACTCVADTAPSALLANEKKLRNSPPPGGASRDCVSPPSHPAASRFWEDGEGLRALRCHLGRNAR